MEETDMDMATENVSDCPHYSLVVVYIRVPFFSPHWLANI